jgi:hypothetical protein
MNKHELRAAKHRQRDANKQTKTRERSQRSRELRCFWTYPFGHVWEKQSIMSTGPIRICRGCGFRDYGNGEQSVGG